jgi:signal transduction histidine kinase
MPQSQPSRSAAIFVLLVVLTIVLGVISYGVIEWRRMLTRGTVATRTNLQELLVAVVDEESGLRGFAATGERLFLQPYYSGQRDFANALAQARSNTAEAQLPEVSADLDAVASLHQRWLREVGAPIIRGHAVVPQLQTEALGKYLVDRMRTQIGHADDLLTQAIDTGSLIIKLSIVGSIGGIVILTSILGATALRSERSRADREREFAYRLSASNEELKRQRASVLALNQLKNDLIAVLAHDIKGPLTSIGGFAELLEDGALDGAAATDAARMIRANAQQLATLTDHVLTLSRIEYGELEIAEDRIDLVDLVRSVVQASLTERAINVHAAVETAFVRGDADRLRQVFENLLRNAIKYSPPDKPIDVTIDSDGDTVRVGVRDYGMGIPPEDLPRLFRRFARASNARRAKIAGTGIGLFIVKMLVERHCGRVDVESTPGEGSLFTVTLPSIDTLRPRRPKAVTILTKDADLSGFVAYELRSRGYRVHECRSLTDVTQSGDLHAGDVLLVDGDVATARDVRTSLSIDGLCLIGLAHDTTNHAGWDVSLAQPFLVADLIAAVRNGASHAS